MYVRFIYCCRWKDTGQPVYVGSSWDPAKRYRQHSRGTSGATFARLLVQHGRDKFTHEIVEAVTGKTRAAAAAAGAEREWYHIQALKTWHTFGGQNFEDPRGKALGEREYKAWRAANKAGVARRVEGTEWRASMGRLPQNPEWLAACKASHPKGVRCLPKLETPKMKRRREKNALGLCGYNACPDQRWQGQVFCHKHTLYFRERGRAQDARRGRKYAAKPAAPAGAV